MSLLDPAGKAAPATEYQQEHAASPLWKQAGQGKRFVTGEARLESGLPLKETGAPHTGTAALGAVPHPPCGWAEHWDCGPGCCGSRTTASPGIRGKGTGHCSQFEPTDSLTLEEALESSIWWWRKQAEEQTDAQEVWPEVSQGVVWAPLPLTDRTAPPRLVQGPGGPGTATREGARDSTPLHTGEQPRKERGKARRRRRQARPRAGGCQTQPTIKGAARHHLGRKAEAL